MIRVVLAALFALVAYGCAHDPFDAGRAPAVLANVSLELEIPASKLVVTYSAADDAARENAVVRLDVFAFDQTGAVVSGSEGHIVLTNINMVNGKGRAMIPVTIPEGTPHVQRRFGIVANATDPAAMAAVTTLDQFRALEFASGATMSTTNFVMSDLSALNTIDAANPTVNLSLRRSVARIDVELQDEVTNFEITSVRLINVRDKGYLFGRNSDETDLSSPVAIPTGSSLISYNAVDATTEDMKRHFSAQLYCLENYNADKDAPAKTTAVIVGGVYNGMTCYYRVNLHDNNREAQVRRNHLYRINVRRVNGAGNPDPNAAIDDSPQNIDYTVSEWDYSQHSDVIFDGKNYLGISESEFSLPKSAGSASVDVVSNYQDTEWNFTPCDKTGAPVAQPAWITFTKSGSKINFVIEENADVDAAPRVVYIKISAIPNPKLSLIVQVQQLHTDQQLVTFQPGIVTPSWEASSGVFKSMVTIPAANTKWSVERLTLMDDASKNWCRLSGLVMVGSSGQTTADNESFELVFDVDQMNASLLSRTATVWVKVIDKSGFEQTHSLTLTQSAISSALTVSRLYIAKTAESDVEQIAINTSSSWTAKFANNTVEGTLDLSWLSFTDQNYTPLSTPNTTSGSGSGAIYVKFDACPANKVRNGYIVVSNGTQEQWIRVHQGDYRTVVINGYEMLDRNLGATIAMTDPNSTISSDQNTRSHGYFYQWGRRPDGYEALGSRTSSGTYFSSSADKLVTRQPIFGDPAWCRYISRGTLPTISLTTGVQNYPASSRHWLSPDVSITPTEQRDDKKLWDARGMASNLLEETNLAAMRTEFDPCPDGWRVPTAREMENILKYGPKSLAPLKASASNFGRFIASDNGGYVYFSTISGRYYGNGNSFAGVDASAAGWYWTSSYSVEAGPYAVRILASDIPDVLYTQRTGRKDPVVYPYLTTAIDNMAGDHAMTVRCIRDRKSAEELVVDTRRRTINKDAQEVTANLITENMESTWTATSTASWLSVSPSAGSTDAVLTIRAVANNTSDVRQGVIRIRSTLGNVANILITQLDESAVLLPTTTGVKRWWRNRNLGATRSDFAALDNDNLGHYYRGGSKIPIPFENPLPSSNHNMSVQAWNLVSAQKNTYGVFPYPIKNTLNDPCPDGWRVPSYGEVDDTFIHGPVGKGARLVAMNGWSNNLKTNDGNNLWFPASGYINSTSKLTTPGTNGYYWTSFASSSTNMSALAVSAAGFYWSSGSTNGNEAYMIRCVQDVSDTFE